jgi:hypothetical protein
MIEQCWPHLKRQTTKKGAPKSKREAEAVWRKAWDELDQNRIREWIERIPFHIQEVIRLEGGNEYQEGQRTVGKTSFQGQGRTLNSFNSFK